MTLAQDRIQAMSVAQIDALAAESRDPGWITAANAVQALVVSQEALIESVRRIVVRLDDVIATLQRIEGTRGDAGDCS